MSLKPSQLELGKSRQDDARTSCLFDRGGPRIAKVARVRAVGISPGGTLSTAQPAIKITAVASSHAATA
jgi:hypothetical protein